MTETLVDIICYLREKGKYDPEAKELAIKLIDLFILSPKEVNDETN